MAGRGLCDLSREPHLELTTRCDSPVTWQRRTDELSGVARECAHAWPPRVEDADAVATHGHGVARVRHTRCVLLKDALGLEDPPSFPAVAHAVSECSRDAHSCVEVTELHKVQDDEDEIGRGQYLLHGCHTSLNSERQASARRAPAEKWGAEGSVLGGFFFRTRVLDYLLS